jgi:hypothetical protein
MEKEVGRRGRGLEYPHALTPALCLRVHDDLVGEGVRVGGGNGRDVIFVSVDDGDDFERCFLEGLFHGTADLDNICASGKG